MKTINYIAARLRDGRSRIRVPVGARAFVLLQKVQTGFGAHPATYSMGTGFLSLG